MAGEAKTNSFVLASATVMVGTQANVLALTPTANSIGLVKNVMVSMTPTYTDLTQGVRGARVASELTNSVTKVSAEVFEYTSENMAYALGLLNPVLTSPTSVYPLTTALAGSTTAPVVTASFSTATDVSASFPSGTWVMIQDAVYTDHAHYVQLSVNATYTPGVPPALGTVVLTFAGYGLTSGNNFLAGANVSLVNALTIGQRLDQPYLSARIVAPLPSGDTVGIILPKVRITKGFNLTFGVEKFDDMPFELDPYDLLPGDPLYSLFPSGGCALLMTNS
jgi:hypothetical protein